MKEIIYIELNSVFASLESFKKEFQQKMYPFEPRISYSNSIDEDNPILYNKLLGIVDKVRILILYLDNYYN